MGRPKKNIAATDSPPVKKVESLEGSLDILTSTDLIWDLILKRLSKISRTYGFLKTETPCFEDARLYENFFQKQLSELSHLVFFEQKNKHAAFRPQILPSVLRAFCERKVLEQSPMEKWSYSGQTYQKMLDGQLKEGYEFGFEVLGNFNHLTEAQTLAAAWEFFSSLGLPDLVIEINHIGDAACQRAYGESLGEYLRGRKYELCDNCNDHLNGRVLNVLRCSNLDCQSVASESPSVLDFLDPDSHKHFTSILEALDEISVPYQLSPLYAGPDGYSKTNLVVKSKYKNQTIVLGEAGYHDDLMSQVYGKNYCCFGFVGNLMAVYQLLEAQKITVEKSGDSEVYLVPLGELAAKKSLRLFTDLLRHKVGVYDHFGSGGVKNQLKAAEAFKVPIALIMGQKEAMDEMVILRDVKSGMQEIISYDKIVDEVKKRLGR